MAPGRGMTATEAFAWLDDEGNGLTGVEPIANALGVNANELRRAAQRWAAGHEAGEGVATAALSTGAAAGFLAGVAYAIQNTRNRSSE